MADEDDTSNEHPIVKVLRQDRAKEDDQATAVLKDYHTVVTYLGAGALGFFLTIHEKFFPLQNGRFFCLFVASLALLFLSLLLYLVAVLCDYFGHSDLRDLMDADISDVDFEKTTQAENDALENKLKQRWQREEKISRILMFTRLILVILGIAVEVVFIALNISTATPKKEASSRIRIEIPVQGDNSIISIDTSEKRAIQIRFQK